MKNTHLHHIIPKHMGGTDDPSNLVELTVEEHAEAHRKLYEEHGSAYDFVAWKALSGQITSDEARRLATIATWTGRNHTEEAKEKIRKARTEQKSSGWNWNEESRKRKSEAMLGTVLSESHKQKIGDALRGKKTRESICPYCGKTGKSNAMKRWHFDNCKRKAF
jgi:hypothetical protein